LKCLYPYQEVKGYREVIAPGNGAQYTGLGLVKLKPKAVFAGESPGKEAVLVILKGFCRVEVDGVSFEGLGARDDVFSGLPAAAYVPLDSNYKITEAAGQEAEVAVLMAAAEKKYPPFEVRPEDVVVKHRGELNYQRKIHDIIVANGEGKVDRIIVGETYSMPGHWSSYPPHKHDCYDLPSENEMEEIYYFKIKPEEGFGVQLIYTADGRTREAYLIKDGDTVAIPYGYHPVAAAPMSQVYYLWVLAGGRGRQLAAKEDPNITCLTR